MREGAGKTARPNILMNRRFIIYPGPHKNDPGYVFPVVEQWDDGAEARFMDPSGALTELIQELQDIIDAAKTQSAQA